MGTAQALLAIRPFLIYNENMAEQPKWNWRHGYENPPEQAAEGEKWTWRHGYDDPSQETKWNWLTGYGKSEKDKAAQERDKKTGGSLWGSSLAAVGAGGLGIGVGLGKICEWMMATDFGADGINIKNKDASESFKQAYDWAYGKKKAA